MLDHPPPRRYDWAMPASKRVENQRGITPATVLANEPTCDEHFRIVLQAPGFAATEPGQFVQLRCGAPAGSEYAAVDWPDGQAPTFTQPELVGRQPLLRRPFSIAGRRDLPDGQAELDVIYRVKGVGTRWLSTVRPGESLSVLGPLGNCFEVTADKSTAVLIGGGVGIPPLLYLAEALAEAGKDTVAFVGARSANHLPLRLLPTGSARTDGRPSRCIAELAAANVETAVATDDGSLGFAGVVSETFSAWLAECGIPPEQITVYACGPEPMLEAVALICLAGGIDAQLSLERYMACGMGTCQSCVCKIRDDSAPGWSFKLCCTDGPVFTAADIIWD